MRNELRAPRALGYRELLLRVPIAAGLLLFVVYLGRILATGTDIALMITVAIVGMVVISFRPMVGFYACYTLLLIVPALDQRVDFPIFHSPLQGIAFITVGAGLLRLPMRERGFPRSSVYKPFVLVMAIFVMFALAGHGPDGARRLYEFAAGMWPLLLTTLLVQTPQQARNVLISLCGSCVALTILWLPGLLALAESKSGQLGAQIRGTDKLIGYADNPGAVSLLGIVGSLGVQTLVSLALIAPVLLAVAMTSRRWRIHAVFGYLTISVTVFAATIASAVVTWAVGSIATLFFVAIMPRRIDWDRVRPVVAVVIMVVGLGLILQTIPPGQRAIYRLAHPADDNSGAVRLSNTYTGWHAFLERPSIGQGVSYGSITYTPGGWAMESHSTWVVLAYQYGLVMLLPFAWLLAALAREFWRLQRRSLRKEDAGLAGGFLACFVAVIVTGFITPTLGQVFQDTIMWTFVGLTIVWSNWRKEDPEAELVAGISTAA